MQKVEDFRKEVELRRRLERNQERFAPTRVLRTVSGPVVWIRRIHRRADENMT